MCTGCTPEAGRLLREQRALASALGRREETFQDRREAMEDTTQHGPSL